MKNIHDKVYDLVVSVGENCYTTMSLIRLGLRTFSSPFDWIRGSDFQSRIVLILNRFDNFLEKSLLLPLPKYSNLHDVYINKATKLEFVHDFPLHSKLSKYDEIKSKYDNRINRLYEKISQSNRLLFVYTQLTDTTSDDALYTYARKVNEKFGKKIDFLLIINDKVASKPLHKDLSDNVSLFRINLEPDAEGRPNRKKLDSIIKLIKVKHNASYLCYKRYLLRFLVNFISVTKLRKKLRRKLSGGEIFIINKSRAIGS